jgi:hypothetical protein
MARGFGAPLRAIAPEKEIALDSLDDRKAAQFLQAV